MKMILINFFVVQYTIQDLSDILKEGKNEGRTGFEIYLINIQFHRFVLLLQGYLLIIIMIIMVILNYVNPII